MQSQYFGTTGYQGALLLGLVGLLPCHYYSALDFLVFFFAFSLQETISDQGTDIISLDALGGFNTCVYRTTSILLSYTLFLPFKSVGLMFSAAQIGIQLICDWRHRAILVQRLQLTFHAHSSATTNLRIH